MENLQDLLGADLHSQVMAKLGEKKLLVDDGKMIPKHRLDELSDNLKAQKELVKSYEDKVKSLEQSAKGNDELTKQITTLQSQISEKQNEYTAKETRTRKTFAVKEGLLNAGVSDADARELLALKFDADKIELDEGGKVKGFDELVKPFKENATLKNLFGQKVMKGQEHQSGDNPEFGEYAGDKNPFSKKSLNLTKQIEIKKANPELAKKLQAAAQK